MWQIILIANIVLTYMGRMKSTNVSTLCAQNVTDYWCWQPNIAHKATMILMKSKN